MPDVHAGTGCVIGFTADLGQRVIPSIVGVDIGCGMLTVELGKQVADYYQELAYDILFGKFNEEEQRRAMIAEYKAIGRTAELEQALKNFQAKVQEDHIPQNLCYPTEDARAAYLHDMKICQEYAVMNRRIIADRILTNLLGRGLETFYSFQTIHNYIDHETNIIRKGAVSAKLGEKLLIPINMRDGSLICTGKGNPEWNYSAPHGAGRLMSRTKAKETLNMAEFTQSMEGIYTTSVHENTIDEAPMTYKPMEAIVSNIHPTVEINSVIRPIYNFKAKS